MKEVVWEFGNVSLIPSVYEEDIVKNPPQAALDAVNMSKEQWTELQNRIFEAVNVVKLERARKQGELDRALWVELNAALSGIKSVEKALADAEIQMKRINQGL
ncbi:hypothetical protein ES708_32876 [subsurface metagenome]